MTYKTKTRFLNLIKKRASWFCPKLSCIQHTPLDCLKTHNAIALSTSPRSIPRFLSLSISLYLPPSNDVIRVVLATSEVHQTQLSDHYAANLPHSMHAVLVSSVILQCLLFARVHDSTLFHTRTTSTAAKHQQ